MDNVARTGESISTTFDIKQHYVVMEMKKEIKEKIIDYRFSEINSRTINSIIKSKISPSLFARNRRELDNNTLLYEIGNCYPKMIWDHDRGIAIYRYINVHPIGIFEVEKISSKKLKIKYPPFDELEKKFEEKMGILRQKSEIALLQTIHDYLVEVPAVKMSLNKFSRILKKTHEKGPIDISYNFGYSDIEKVRRYLKILNDFDFIEIKDNKIYSGIEIKALMDTELIGKEFYNKLLANVLRKSFSSIKNYLNITLIDPYLKLSNSYFLPSYQVSKRLKFESRDFKRSLFECYNMRRPIDTIENQLDFLTEDNGVFEKTGDKWISSENVFNGFIDNFTVSYPNFD